MFKKTLTTEQVIRKLQHYCGYQERSHHEVQQKLYELGIWKKDHDAIIATLIEQDYLNEERFVKAYAGGRFRMKGWGRIRICYELKQRKISEYLIKKAMAEIPEEDYLQKMEKLITDKYDSLGSDGHLIRRKKTVDYMTGKGFESNLVIPFLSGLMASRRNSAVKDPDI
ncbi:MAG: regulatory protein RecX [Chitinophagaceae bacterium]